MLKFWTCLALLVPLGVGVTASEESRVECEVKLTDYLPNAPYYEELDGVHSDFRAPEAIFSVESPSKFEGRRIRVIFLSSKYDGVLAELINGIGGDFILKLPTDYFDYPDGTVIKSYLIHEISRAD